VVTEPFARLSLEGGWDSNVLYDGRGGDRVGRVSPELGGTLRDHLWTLFGAYGVDVVTYPTRAPGPTVNHRGRLELEQRMSPRTTLDLKLSGGYAIDPAGLARVGIVGRTGEALLLRGDGRLAWRATPRLTLAATFLERAARLSEAGGSGSAMHAPGVEAAWRLDPRTEVGVAYRLDWFQSFTDGVAGGIAHEAKAIGRWRWSRRLTLEAEAGPAVWTGTGGPSIVPEAGITLLASGRQGDLRVQYRHGLGLSALARPSVTDAAEVGAVWRITRSVRLRADGGLWRGGRLPTGRDATLGYGASGELAWLATRTIEVGVAASRFARIDDPSPATERNVVGLRMGWQLDPH
jgi:hypothetical protein